MEYQFFFAILIVIVACLYVAAASAFASISDEDGGNGEKGARMLLDYWRTKESAKDKRTSDNKINFNNIVDDGQSLNTANKKVSENDDKEDDDDDDKGKKILLPNIGNNGNIITQEPTEELSKRKSNEPNETPETPKTPKTPELKCKNRKKNNVFSRNKNFSRIHLDDNQYQGIDATEIGIAEKHQTSCMVIEPSIPDVDADIRDGVNNKVGFDSFIIREKYD